MKLLEIGAHQVDQVLDLIDETIAQPQGPLAPASSVAVRHIELRIGKLTLPDVYDVNDIGSGSHLQFMNWTVDNNGAWDYAADTRGYGGWAFCWAMTS